MATQLREKQNHSDKKKARQWMAGLNKSFRAMRSDLQQDQHRANRSAMQEENVFLQQVSCGLFPRRLFSLRKKRKSAMKHLTDSPLLRALQIFTQPLAFDGPRRKRLEAPLDRGTFVKPIKQSFIKNLRLMPGTRIVLTLLAGWAGHDKPIETTLGIIGKHLGRSARQVQRYLKDAMEEGYLRTAYTKDQIGRITGLRIYLTRMAIFHQTKKPCKTAEKLATTYPSDTKENNKIKTVWNSWLTRQASSRYCSDVFDVERSSRLACKAKLLLAQATMPTVTQRQNGAENVVTACRGEGLERLGGNGSREMNLDQPIHR